MRKALLWREKANIVLRTDDFVLTSVLRLNFLPLKPKNTIIADRVLLALNVNLSNEYSIITH